jgi:hypothetical protein
MSPVADPTTSRLWQADLYGFTSGVDFQLTHFGASLGAGYQFGTSSPSGFTVNDLVSQGTVKIQSISIFYAFSYQF